MAALLATVLFLVTTGPSPAIARTTPGLLSPHALQTPRHDGCAHTKSLKVAGLSFDYPSCWTRGNYHEDSMFFTVVAMLSNQPMHNPCTTTRTTTGLLTHCGYPLTSLANGGVLVLVSSGGMPGWRLSHLRGRHLVVDHRAAVESVIPTPSLPIPATEEIDVVIQSTVADAFDEVTAFFRSPGVAGDQLRLRKLIDSLTFD